MMYAGTSGRIVTDDGDIPFGSWTISHTLAGVMNWSCSGLNQLVKSARTVVFDCGPWVHTLTKTRLGGNGGTGGVLATYVNR